MKLTDEEKLQLRAYIKDLGYNPLAHPVDAEIFIKHWYDKIRPNADKVYPKAKVLEND